MSVYIVKQIQTTILKENIQNTQSRTIRCALSYKVESQMLLQFVFVPKSKRHAPSEVL